MLNTLFLEEGLNIPIDKITPSIGMDLLDFKACCSFESSYESFYFLYCIVFMFNEFLPAFSAVVINNDEGITVSLDRGVERAL